jgi:crotonobetainyl-CoA:carnitine CoA-transferase CaiB-like acyl-CoA transferase
VAGELATRTTAQWLELLERADIPAMRLHDLESLLADPHLEAVGFFHDAEHPSEGPIRVMDVPARWSETPPSIRRHAPRLGEHSVEVLAEAGYSRAEIDELLAAGTTLAPA